MRANTTERHHERRPDRHCGVPRLCALHRTARAARSHDESGAVGRGWPRLRHAACLPSDGRRGVLDLHVPRRERMGVQQGAPRLLHPRLRRARLSARLLDAAGGVASRNATRLRVVLRLLRDGLPLARAGCRRLGSRRARHERAADHSVARTGHHRVGGVVRHGSAGGRDLVRRDRDGGVHHGVGHSRFREHCDLQGHPDSRHCRVPRRLSAAALLRRIRRDVRPHRSGAAGLFADAHKRPDAVLVQLHDSAHVAGLLPVSVRVPRTPCAKTRS